MSENIERSTWTRFLVYWGPVVGYAGLIFYFSAQPNPEDLLLSFLFEDVSDKVLHAVEYGLLALVCYRAFRWGRGRLSLGRRSCWRL